MTHVTTQHRSGAPLAGRSVVVTRAREQAGPLVAGLRDLGADVLEFPAISITDPPDIGLLDDAIRRLGDYDWVVLSSANAVTRFFGRLVFVDRTAEALTLVKTAAVGSSTAERMRAYGVEPDFVPDDFSAEGLVAGFAEMGAGVGWRILVPRALDGREHFAQELQALGAQVDVVAAYRTVPVPPDPAVIEKIAAGEADAVVFTSPSTVRSFAAAVANTAAEKPAAALFVASIGPTTTRAAVERGMAVGVEASEHSVPGLLRALAEALGSR